MARKTKLMQRVEREHQRPLEKLLPEKVNELGLSGAAEFFDVSKATLGYWILKLGINVRRVALAPGENLTVSRAADAPPLPAPPARREREPETIRIGDARLTQAQLDVLGMVRNGVTVGILAERLGVSIEKAQRNLQVICIELGMDCPGKEQAYAALQAGIAALNRRSA